MSICLSSCIPDNDVSLCDRYWRPSSNELHNADISAVRPGHHADGIGREIQQTDNLSVVPNRKFEITCTYIWTKCKSWTVENLLEIRRVSRFLRHNDVTCRWFLRCFIWKCEISFCCMINWASFWSTSFWHGSENAAGLSIIIAKNALRLMSRSPYYPLLGTQFFSGQTTCGRANFF